jgi:hypothetical protein
MMEGIACNIDAKFCYDLVFPEGVLFRARK